MKVSIIIRTYNEAKHLPELLASIAQQRVSGFEVETVVVDSGSTDGSVKIAERSGCIVKFIRKKDFSFGRSLNIGCETASGDLLVFVSGHCIPMDHLWLENLIQLLRKGVADYVYGKQRGNGSSHFSERQLFKKHFPEVSSIPQEGYFINNANAALTRRVWEKYRFDESLTGLEDMELAKRLIKDGKRLAYVSCAGVYHLHDECWRQIKWRYQREALALQKIMPEVQIAFADFVRYLTRAIFLDSKAAIQDQSFWSNLPGILAFRFMQLWGSFRGNHEHRKLSRAMKERYFFPR